MQKLVPEWIVNRPAGTFPTNPLVVDGVMFFSTPFNPIAVDAVTEKRNGDTNIQWRAINCAVEVTIEV